jgi:acyl carrier protein
VSSPPDETYGTTPCTQCGKALWFCKLPEGAWYHDAEKVAALRTRVVQVVAKQLGADATKITDATSFVEDLGADSLDIVELVMSLEEEFGVKIPDEDAEKIRTVGQLLNWLLLHQP